MRIHIQNPTIKASAKVTQAFWEEAATRAGAIGQGHEVSLGGEDADLAPALAEAEVLVTSVQALPRRLPVAAPKLRMIFVANAGVDGLAPFDWLPPEVTLVNNSGTHADKAGEYIAMAVLMLANRMPELIDQQRDRVWGRQTASVLTGRRATIVGLGALGGGGARRLQPFGLDLTGVRTRPEPHPHCDRVVSVADLDAVLPDTEFLVLACPLTPQTRELLDRRRIALLPRGAGVVNVGRGGLIEQDALLDALDDGRLGGAVLDVMVPEPPPADHRLWRTRNLVLTPHMSSDDPNTYTEHSLDIFFANLRALQDGTTLPNRIDPERGY